MNMDSPNSAEYIASKKVEGMLLVKRILLIVLYITFTVGYFGVCAGIGVIQLVAVLPILLWMLIFFTWRYVSYDDAYTFSSGTMVFSRVYAKNGKRISREKLRIRVQDAKYAGLWSGGRRDDEMRNVKKLYDFASSANSADAVFVVFDDPSGVECAVRFDCISRVKKLLVAFCRRTDFGSHEFRY